MPQRLIIRQSQMRILIRAHEEEFQRGAARHLRSSFPETCAQYSDAELARIVAAAVERTEHYSIRREADILRWVNLMFALGFDFDNNPKYPWVLEVLSDPDTHPDAIMPWLSERAIRYLKAKERA
jgi:hypothetical protein